MSTIKSRYVYNQYGTKTGRIAVNQSDHPNSKYSITGNRYFAFHEFDSVNISDDHKFFKSMHLSDTNGVPMHGIENALFWAGFKFTEERTKEAEARKQIYDAVMKTAKLNDYDAKAAVKAAGLADAPTTIRKPMSGTPNAENLASHLRIDLSFARHLINGNESDLTNAVNSMYPRWKREAEMVIDYIDKGNLSYQINNLTIGDKIFISFYEKTFEVSYPVGKFGFVLKRDEMYLYLNRTGQIYDFDNHWYICKLESLYD